MKKSETADLAGDSADKLLWNSYFYQARLAIDPRSAQHPALTCRENRLGVEMERALQGIVFTAFALEYRVRRVLDSNSIKVRKRDGLWRLLDILEPRLRDNGVTLPNEWGPLKEQLVKLARKRDKIVHANYQEAMKLLGDTEALCEAAVAWNHLVMFIAMMNKALDRRPVADEDYEVLRIDIPEFRSQHTK